jgi:O-antigen ligase
MLNNSLKSIGYGGYLTFFAGITVIILLPVNVYFLPPFMILWGVFWLVENDFKFKKEMFSGNKVAILFLLFIGFYLWQIAGLLFSHSIDSGFERIFKRLSFLLFPLVLFYPGEKIFKHINLLIRLFTIATFLFIIYCFVQAFNNSLLYQEGRWIFNPHPADFDYENFFLGSRFSNPVHPSYLSMYIVLSILISFEALFAKSISLFKRATWLILVLVLLLVLYLLSSRAGFLAAIIIFPCYFFYKFYHKFSKWLIISSLSGLCLVLILIAKTNERISYDFKGISADSIDVAFKKDVRNMIWKSAFGVIEHNLLLGVGTGDASKELKKEFVKRGYVEGYYDNLNAHNQYFEILLENGIIGLILFISILGYMIFISISDRNLIYGLFIFMMMGFFFFETILNRLAGITFFTLFSFLLIHLKNPYRIE